MLSPSDYKASEWMMFVLILFRIKINIVKLMIKFLKTISTDESFASLIALPERA